MAVTASWRNLLLWFWLFVLLMVYGESDHHRSSNPPRHPRNNHHHNNNHHNNNKNHNNHNNHKANYNHQKNRQNNNNDKDQEYHNHGHGSSRQWLFQPVHPHPHPPSSPLDTSSPPPSQPSLVYPGQPRYVRAVDEGLYYGVIHPYLPEVPFDVSPPPPYIIFLLTPYPSTPISPRYLSMIIDAPPPLWPLALPCLSLPLLPFSLYPSVEPHLWTQRTSYQSSC